MTSKNALRVLSNRVRNRVHHITSSPSPCHMNAASTLPFSAGLGQSISESQHYSITHHRRRIQHQIRSYGSKARIEIDTQPLPGMETIQPYLRTCLSSDEGDANRGLDMEFAVSFLGTGGGAPTMHRNASCTALRLGGQTYLFDVSEGTVRQLEFTRISPSTITKIFVSHLHGDHLFGVVPTILDIMVGHKTLKSNPQKRARHTHNHGERATLEIYGPPGLYNYISMVLALSCSKVNYLNVDVIELVGGREEQGPVISRPRQRGRRNIFLSHYPEIDQPMITRKYLQQNEENVWIIDEPEPITQQSLEKGAKHPKDKFDGFHRLPNDVNLGLGRRLHIKAAELDHLGGVQTFGYTVEEQAPPGNIDVKKAQALGIKPSKKYALLKCGLSVPTDDGTGEVRPEQVLTTTFRPRKFAFLADHRRVPRPMAQLCRNADLLVHEATLSKADGLERIKIRGHNTAYNAGMFGKKFGCKVVALNHFGSTSIGREYVMGQISEAREGNCNASQIISSYDFMEVWIPRGGFNFDAKND